MNLQGKYNSVTLYNKKRKYRINKKKYHSKSSKKIVFVNKHSINNKSLKFTNFLQRGISNPRNQFIKNQIDNCIINPSYFDKNFEGREVSIQTNNNIKKIKRLNDILQCYQKFPHSNDIVYKFTLINTKERGFQVLFTSKNDTKYIYLIDLYHLAIPSKNNKNKERFDLHKEYYSKEKYHIDIKDVLFIETEKETV